MPGQSKLFDITVGVCSHSLPCCSHGCVGVRVTGSGDTNVNGLAASRAPMDLAVHSCPHCGVNMTLCGSSNININNLSAHRLGDCEVEFCGLGVTVTGSSDTNSN